MHLITAPAIALVEQDRSIIGTDDDSTGVSHFTLFVQREDVVHFASPSELYLLYCLRCQHPTEHCYCPCAACGLSLMQCDCPPLEACRSGCGRQLVLSYESTPGFCAGTVFTAQLACGHTNVDDCSYLEA